MKYSHDLHVLQSFTSSLFRECSYTYNDFGPEFSDNVMEGLVAQSEEVFPVLGSELIGSEVAGSAVRSFLQEEQGTVIQDDVFTEECFSSAETLTEESPESFAADFRACTLKASNWVRRVSVLRSIDVNGGDAEKISDRENFAEGYASLSHAPRSWVHAEKGDAWVV